MRISVDGAAHGKEIGGCFERGDEMGGQFDRAYAALLGLALGDAMGMPTQMLSPDQIRRRYGYLETFAEGMAAPGLSSNLPAGRITDDTEQALLVVEAVTEAVRTISAGWQERLTLRMAAKLVAWYKNLDASAALSLGPSSRLALGRLLQGVSPREAGVQGDTNGASMRIAPVGIAFAEEALLLDAVEACSRPTHYSGIALAGATLVAAMVSRGVAGDNLLSATETALRLAEKASRRGPYTAGASVVARTRRAIALACQTEQDRLDRVRSLADEIGTGMATTEAVPTAVALLYIHSPNPWKVIVEATNLGGDTDTIGAMAGAMAGAFWGSDQFPPDLVRTMVELNRLDLRRDAQSLLAVRHAQEKGRTG